MNKMIEVIHDEGMAVQMYNTMIYATDLDVITSSLLRLDIQDAAQAIQAYISKYGIGVDPRDLIAAIGNSSLHACINEFATYFRHANIPYDDIVPDYKYGVFDIMNVTPLNPIVHAWYSITNFNLLSKHVPTMLKYAGMYDDVIHCLGYKCIDIADHDPEKMDNIETCTATFEVISRTEIIPGVVVINGWAHTNTVFANQDVSTPFTILMMHPSELSYSADESFTVALKRYMDAIISNLAEIDWIKPSLHFVIEEGTKLLHNISIADENTFNDDIAEPGLSLIVDPDVYSDEYYFDQYEHDTLSDCFEEYLEDDEDDEDEDEDDDGPIFPGFFGSLLNTEETERQIKAEGFESM